MWNIGQLYHSGTTNNTWDPHTLKLVQMFDFLTYVSLLPHLHFRHGQDEAAPSPTSSLPRTCPSRPGPTRRSLCPSPAPRPEGFHGRVWGEQSDQLRRSLAKYFYRSEANTGRLRDSRGEEQRAVHQRAVVVVADEVVHLGGLVTQVRPVGGLDVHCVLGVVEVDDVNVKHEDSWWWDDVTCEI